LRNWGDKEEEMQKNGTHERTEKKKTLENSRTQVLRKIENITSKYILGKTYKTKHQTPTYGNQKTQTRNLKWSQNN